MAGLPSVTVTEALGSAPDVVAELLGERLLKKSLRDAGLPESLSFHVGHYIPEIAINRFFDSAAKHAGDDLFGLHFMEHLSVQEYGAWGDYVLEAKTLGAALQRAVDIIHLHADSDRLVLVTNRSTTHLDYFFSETASEGYQQIALAALGPLLSIPRYYCGSNWRPVSIGVDLSDKRSVKSVETTLNLETTSDRGCISIEIPNSQLSKLNPTTRTKWTTLEDVERECLGGPPEGLVPFVERLIVQRLGTGLISLDDIAFTMATSRRTLQRQFDQQGTEFRSVVLRAKMRRAIELLNDTSISIHEIAMLLDYSTTSHFARAFQKSQGCTPQEYRAAKL